MLTVGNLNNTKKLAFLVMQQFTSFCFLFWPYFVRVIFLQESFWDQDVWEESFCNQGRFKKKCFVTGNVFRGNILQSGTC